MGLVPFPPTLPRNVDFLPSLQLQAQLDSRKKLRFAVGRVSVSKTSSRPPTRIGDMEIRRSRKRADCYEAILGADDTASAQTWTVKEMYQDLMNEGIPDVTIQCQLIEHDIPPALDEFPEFQGYDFLLEHTLNSFNTIHQWRRQFGTFFWNPRQAMTGRLLAQGVVRNKGARVLKRLVSTMVTDFVCPDAPYLGWGHFGGRCEVMLEELAKEQWFHDTAIPLQARIDSSIQQNIRIFRLKKENQLLPLKI